jgi:phosphoglycolate phosphatase
MKKYVVFDFDGTIVDSRSQFIKAFNDVAAKFGFRKIRGDELDYLSSMSVKVSFAERYRMLGFPLYKLPLALIKAPRAAKEIRENLRKGISTLKEFDGMREVFFKLKKSGYKLAIISTNSASNIEEFLKRNNLEIFDRIFSSKGLFGKGYTIKKFLSKMKIEKEEMIYIGDELRDIVACQKTGVDIISVSWGYNSQDTLKQGNPQFIALSPDELTEMVDKTLIYA